MQKGIHIAPDSPIRSQCAITTLLLVVKTPQTQRLSNSKEASTTPLTLTAELEQEIIANLRRVPSHQLAAIINLVSSLGTPPDQTEETEKQEVG